jgi:hypothetical protein
MFPPMLGKSRGPEMAGDEYRRHAGDCVKAAALVIDPKAKAILIDMAAAWLRLADQAERNSQTSVVYEAPYVTNRAKP